MPTLRTGTICTPRITPRKRVSITRRNMAAKAKQVEPSQTEKPARVDSLVGFYFLRRRLTLRPFLGFFVNRDGGAPFYVRACQVSSCSSSYYSPASHSSS